MFSVNEINSAVKNNPSAFIEKCESIYHKQLREITAEICSKKSRQLVLLAGPSSSGKTTTASLLKSISKEHSRNAFVISLDDFYRNQEETLFFEDGTPDYETIEALDTQYISHCLSSLLKNGECMLPKFNFKTGKREEELVLLKAEKDDVIIVEGLHAINPRISDELHESDLTKLYVSVSTRITENSRIFLKKRELRFIRRMIRDYHHRNASVELTFKLWNAVRMGEDRYLFPFKNLADRKIDSIHAYEPCVFKNEAIKLLDQIGSDSVYYTTAKELTEKLEQFEPLNKNYLPENSLLHEFVG